MTEIAEFLDRLASAEPVPGGGSVAALECSLGAALLVMVANLTVGRKRYADVECRVLRIKSHALELGERATSLIDEDIAAYGGVARVMELPRETDEQKAHRRACMQDALKSAVQPPLETMRTASGLLDLAAELTAIGNRSAISDVGTAAGAARAGFEAARLNVEINLAAIVDEDWVRSVRASVDSFPPAAERAEQVEQQVLAAIRG